MKMKSLRSLQSVLIINWLVVPILAICVFIVASVVGAVIYLLLWLVVDKMWDYASGLLIEGVGRIGRSEKEALNMERYGEVPIRMAAMMLLDLIGTLAIPWIIAAFYFL